MLNVLKKHNTLFNFYPLKTHFFYSKNNFNYISKAKQEYQYNLYRKEKKSNKIIINSPIKNNNNLIRNITTTKSFNFWKESNNNNGLKSERETENAEHKFKVNSKLFEQFINDFEKKMKKSLNNIEAKDHNYQYRNACLDNYNSINNENYKNIYSQNSYNGNNNKIFQANNTINTTNNNRLLKKTKSFEHKEIYKKKRILSSSPYTIKATMNHNINHFQRNTKSDINTFFNTNKNENKLLNYEIGKIIGKGAYATVKICINKITQEKFAMKIYDKKKLNDDIKKRCVLREIEILKKLNHQNISKLYDIIITDKQILLIQELVNGVSLRDFYNKEIRNQQNISENKFKILTLIFKQIFSAFDYIHKKYISHRDIKLENILITKNYDIKIIDFGFGIYNPRNYLQKFFCGTPNYMAPEIVMKKEYIGEKADIWSLGILLYKLFCADFPFKGKNERELYKNIIRGKYRIREYVPLCVKDIIKKMIVSKPEQRINCEQILKTPWLKD